MRVSTLVVLALALPAGLARAQDKTTVKAANGVALSEFKGYEDWQDVAVSTTDDGIKVIVANPAMIAAYRSGVPGNGKPFPEGSKVVKIEWRQAKNPQSPYNVIVPGALKSVAVIEKDSKRFPDTSGWGYADFQYTPATKTLKAEGADAAFAKQVCYSCHTAVKAKDYIFTAYPIR